MTTRTPAHVGHVLEAALAEDPDRCALVGRDRRYSYAELDTAANAAAVALASVGVGHGDRVAVSLPNDTDVVVAFHGVMRLGAVWVGLNQLLTPSEKAALIDDCGATLLLCDERCEIAGDPPSLTEVVTTALDAPTSWPLLVEARLGQGAPPVTIDPGEPAAIAYTSGTTGRPKGVVHSQAGLLLPGASLVASRRYGADLVKGDCLALTILNLLVLSTLLVAQAKGTCVVMDRRDAAGIARWLRQERVTTWNGVPTMLYDLVHDDSVTPEDLATLSEVWSGGAPCPEPLRDAFEEKFGRRPLTTYGLTEAPTVVTIEDRSSPGPPGSSGRALPHLAVRVVDESDHEVPAGESGEICLGAPEDASWGPRFATMLGYWQQPGATASVLRDGLLHTGDVGYLDRGGNLFVQDRKTLVIMRGGAKIYPAEVEAVLLGADGVRGCAVLGVPDERLGEAVVAVVEVGDGFFTPADGEVLRRHCAERLARYKVPDRFVVGSLPRNAMGKVRRDALKGLI